MQRLFITIILLTGVLNSICLSQSDNSSINQWLILGSFPADTIHEALDSPFITDEAGVMPKAGEQDERSSLTWRNINLNPGEGLNFLEYNLGNITYCAVYAASYVYTTEEMNVIFSIGSDDGYSLWVNQEKLSSKLVFRGLVRGEDKVPARLAAGWNRILFKVINSDGGFGLAVDILDETNKPLTNIVFSNRKPPQMTPPVLSAYAFIDNISFAPSYLENNKRIYPLVISVKNLGENGNHPGNAILDTRISRWHSTNFNLNKSTDIIFPVQARELYNKLDMTCGIRLYLDGKKNDDEIFKLKPEWLLQSLFKSKDLPEELVQYKSYFADLEDNAGWYETFTGSPLIYQPSDLSDCMDHALHNEWDTFKEMLNGVFSELFEFSTVIKRDTLHMIGQSHIDMAWLWRWPETVEVTQKTLQSALNFFKEQPDYKYIQSQAVCFEWIEQKYPDLFTAIREAVKQGRFFLVGGMWVEPDLNLTGGESLVRQILYGKQYFREKFGVDCITGYTPDTFGYTWTLPQILKKSGYKYFVTSKIRWNDTTEFPHSIFRWYSPDGSEILTCLPMGLNMSNYPAELADHLLKYKKEGYNNLPVLFGVGDHGGGPTRQHFEQINKMQNLAAYPALFYDDLDSYMARIDDKYPDLPEYKSDLYLEYHRGTLTTQGKIKKYNRRSEIAMEEAEKLAVFSGIDYPGDSLETAWKKTLFNQFHDILPGSSIPAVYTDAEKDYNDIFRLTGEIIDNSLNCIAKKINLDEKHIPVIVFNTLSWTRDGLVTVNLKPGLTIKEVYNSDNNELHYQQMGDQLIFTAEQVPQNGYKVYWLRKGKNGDDDNGLKITPTSLENKLLRVEINPKNGNISRLYDKRAKREILAPGKEANILQFFEDKPEQYDAWNIGYTGKSWTCEKVKSIFILEKGPVRAVLRVIREFGNSTFTQDYTIYEKSRRLDIKTVADWHEHHILLKAAFPVNVNADFATYDIAYGSIQRTTKPQTPAEKARFEVAAHKYIDLSRSDYGVTLMNDCKYGHDVEDNVMRITLLRSPLTPDPLTRPQGYQNPFADQGEHEFVYSVYPHTGDQIEANSIRRACELNYPLKALVTEKHKGEWEPEKSFITLDADNLILTVVKKAEDSDARVIRLYETHGKQVETELHFDAPVQRAWEADLLENKKREITVTDNTVPLKINPYKICTLIVE
ncbi:alpha-mannosidase [candidate division KSB1 bacterium]|nr:alpha-mannosidase [candidate division KSB1 bacterium]